MRSDDRSPLATHERQLLDALLALDFQGVEGLRVQSRTVEAKKGCTCGCGSIDLFPQGADLPHSNAASPVPGEGRVFDESGEKIGGLLLFLAEGKLSYLEIYFVSSSDGGATFTTPKSIAGNVLYGQGSRPVVGPDGTLYVFWDGATRQAALDSTYMVKSSDGGATWSQPLAVSTLNESSVLKDTAFRDNSFPAAAVAPNGDVYATWTTQTADGSVAVYSKSTDGGAKWSVPARDFPAVTRSPVGYPVAQPSSGDLLQAPDPSGAVEDIFPAVAIGPNGHVLLATYRGDVVSPWQTCAAGPPPPVGRIECDTLGDYINNTRLDYYVHDISTGEMGPVSTHPINIRNGFGGGFFGDYTDIAVGSDNVFHAFWTDSNNQQEVTWFYGAQFVPTPINQEDVVTDAGTT